MSLRDALLPVVNGIRKIPTALGVRNVVVKRVIRTWSGGSVGAGTKSDSELQLIPNPKVKELLNGSALELKWMTPSPGGSQTYAQLRPTLAANQEVFWLVIDPSGQRRYEQSDIDTSRPFHWTITLQTLERTNPY